MKQVLRDVAWREAVDSWREEARSHSKLAEVQKLVEKGYEARCVEMKWKRRRRILVQLRGGTTALEVETGRWWGVRREERVCRNCRSEEVENVEQWLLRCAGMAEERDKLIMTMREKVGGTGRRGSWEALVGGWVWWLPPAPPTCYRSVGMLTLSSCLPFWTV